MNRRWIPGATFLLCALTCIAAEAIRVVGFFNRAHPYYKDHTVMDVAFGQWQYHHLFLYFLIFMPFFVVICNPQHFRIRGFWLGLSIVFFAVSSLAIPDAVDGRWGNSALQNLGLFYQLVLPIPAILFIVFGLGSLAIARRRQGDGR